MAIFFRGLPATGVTFHAAICLGTKQDHPPQSRGPAPVPDDVVRLVSEAAQFPSREAIPRRPPRIYRIGRTMQFNARATPETVEAFYAIADQQRSLVSEALEHALAALQRELAGQGRG